MKQIVVTVRAIIIHQGKLVMCRQNQPNRAYYNLPGGRLELKETISEGMIRELIEETGITPQLGHIMFINQFIDATHHRVEFFFYVTNGADYAKFDPAKASHAHEVADFTLGDPTLPAFGIQPAWLGRRWAEITRDPTAIQAEIVTAA